MIFLGGGGGVQICVFLGVQIYLGSKLLFKGVGQIKRKRGGRGSGW